MNNLRPFYDDEIDEEIINKPRKLVFFLIFLLILGLFISLKISYDNYKKNELTSVEAEQYVKDHFPITFEKINQASPEQIILFKESIKRNFFLKGEYEATDQAVKSISVYCEKKLNDLDPSVLNKTLENIIKEQVELYTKEFFF